jgi:hypothetical protein
MTMVGDFIIRILGGLKRDRGREGGAEPSAIIVITMVEFS